MRDNPGSSDLDLPIALCSVNNQLLHILLLILFHIIVLPSFHHLSLSISSVSIPKTYQKVIMNSSWKQAMNEKMNAFLSRETWDLVTGPQGLILSGADGYSQ